MMNYEDIMEKYYSSEDITHIPDRWTEYVPVGFYAKGFWSILLIYFIESEKAELKQATFISGEDGKIKVLTPNNLKERYQISQIVFELTDEQNDIFFDSKDEYVELFEESFNKLQAGEKITIEMADRLSYLLGIIVPKNIRNDIYRKICGDNWDRLGHCD